MEQMWVGEAVMGHGGVSPVSPGADVGGGEPSPGADVGGDEPSPGADVAAVHAWNARTIAALECAASRPPCRITAFADFRQSDAICAGWMAEVRRAPRGVRQKQPRARIPSRKRVRPIGAVFAGVTPLCTDDAYYMVLVTKIIILIVILFLLY